MAKKQVSRSAKAAAVKWKNSDNDHNNNDNDNNNYYYDNDNSYDNLLSRFERSVPYHKQKSCRKKVPKKNI